MGQLDVNFNPSIFKVNFPIIIATNRNTAILLPMRVRYQAGGYIAGTVMARNTTDGWFQKYNDGGSSGIDTARCVLFESLQASDFDGASVLAATGSTTAVGIFGQCVLYYDNLVGIDANGLTDLNGKLIIDATGVNLLKF